MKNLIALLLTLTAVCLVPAQQAKAQDDYAKQAENRKILEQWSKIRSGIVQNNVSSLLGQPSGIQVRNDIEYWIYRDAFGQTGWVAFQIWPAKERRRPTVKNWAQPPAELPAYSESTNHHYHHFD